MDGASLIDNNMLCNGGPLAPLGTWRLKDLQGPHLFWFPAVPRMITFLISNITLFQRHVFLFWFKRTLFVPQFSHLKLGIGPSHSHTHWRMKLMQTLWQTLLGYFQRVSSSWCHSRRGSHLVLRGIWEYLNIGVFWECRFWTSHSYPGGLRTFKKKISHFSKNT